MKKLKKVPKFKSEDEEFEFWSTHDLTDYVNISKGKRVIFSRLKPTEKTTSLRLPVYLMEELKMLANKIGIPYQSLMKVYLAQRVKQELKFTKP